MRDRLQNLTPRSESSVLKFFVPQDGKVGITIAPTTLGCHENEMLTFLTVLESVANTKQDLK